jgi:hypothetical protein
LLGFQLFEKGYFFVSIYLFIFDKSFFVSIMKVAIIIVYVCVCVCVCVCVYVYSYVLVLCLILSRMSACSW